MIWTVETTKTHGGVIMKVMIGEIYKNRATIFTADETIRGKSFPVKEATIGEIHSGKISLKPL